MPARTCTDEIIGTMLVQLLQRGGDQSQCLTCASSAEMVDQLVEGQPDLVVVSALQPSPLTHVRKLYSLIESRLPQATIVLGLWNFNGAAEGVSARFGPDTRGLIVTNLATAVAKLSALEGERRVSQDADAIASH